MLGESVAKQNVTKPSLSFLQLALPNCTT